MRQMPDKDKKHFADFVIDTSSGKNATYAQIDDILRALKQRVQRRNRPMREIVFDTETTGLDNREDRIIEIGGVELVDRFPTGKTFHIFIEPEGGRIAPRCVSRPRY